MIKTKTENSITFHIEALERPTELIEEKKFSEILKKYSNTIEYAPNIENNLIPGGYHSFLYGLYLAYSQHRPFTLSPDMIWLLVLQGISNHVNFSHVSGNNIFPEFNKKKTIKIKNNNIIIGNPESPWHETIEEFSNEIEEIFGVEMIAKLRCDFSTTTSASKLVSEITIMDTFKAYFEYIVAVCICGIPEMKLEGSISDWNHMLAKLDILKKYDLDWWYDDLKPILTKIKDTAKGNIDNEFWMHIFKVHTIEEYGSPKYIDGWITNFFPYNRKGERINFKELQQIQVTDIFEELPKQIVNVDFKHHLEDDFENLIKETPLEYWGGFVGISQNHTNQFLKPEIDWFISHKTNIFKKDVNEEVENDPFYTPSKIFYNLDSIPDEVYTEEFWGYLALNFKSKVNIPEKIKEVSLRYFCINGVIDDETVVRLKSYFDLKNVYIKINGKRLREIRFTSEEYNKQKRYLKLRFVPKSGPSKFVQGELIRVVEILRIEAQEHNNKNLSKKCRKELINYIDTHLADYAVFDSDYIHEIYDAEDLIKHIKKPYKENDIYDFLLDRIVDWHAHYGSVPHETLPNLCY